MYVCMYVYIATPFVRSRSAEKDSPDVFFRTSPSVCVFFSKIHVWFKDTVCLVVFVKFRAL